MKPAIYRQIIDHLVEVCKDKEGQGQIGPRRARAGLWNQNAREGYIPDQHRINVFLKELTKEQREILAQMLEEQVFCGVSLTLLALEEFKIEPFLDGYEGSPYHDFVGRFADDQWQWPRG